MISEKWQLVDRIKALEAEVASLEAELAKVQAEKEAIERAREVEHLFSLRAKKGELS